MYPWKKYIVFALFFIPGYLAVSQVHVKASIDSTKILIGEPIHLTLEAYVPLGQELKWFFPDTFPHFEWINKSNIDTVENLEGKKFSQMVTITSFDSGNWEIPALTMVVENKAYLTEPLAVNVEYADVDTSADYRDIKDVEDVIIPYLKYIPWIIAVLTLISGLLIFYFLRKKPVTIKRTTVSSRLSAYDEAMQSLAELRRSGMPENGQVKLYYTRLNDILRLFILRKLQIATMEKTNEELILQLRDRKIPGEHFSLLAQALRMADFVKFAKYQPAKDDNEKNLLTIESSIQTLNNIP